jgi:hypothetical protein
MSKALGISLTAAAISLFSASLYGQSVISAKAGLVHYTEGKVFVDDKIIEPKIGDFVEMKAGDVLRTSEGRAEVLLTPGVFLRVGENSSFKLVNNKLEDIRLHLLHGSVIVEAGEVNKYDSIVVTAGAATINVEKRGLFRIDSDPLVLRVFDGEAVVAAGGQELKVKEGKTAALNGVLVAEKFNKDWSDPLQRWAGRRAGYLASANLSAAKSILDSGNGWRSSGWYFNPYFGYFTFVPAFGNYYSPFGYHYYTPRRVDGIYNPPTYAGGGGNGSPGFIDRSSSGWSGGGGRGAVSDGGGRGSYSSGGYSGGSAPAPSAAPAAAPPTSTGGSGGHRGGGR